MVHIAGVVVTVAFVSWVSLMFLMAGATNVEAIRPGVLPLLAGSVLTAMFIWIVQEK